MLVQILVFLALAIALLMPWRLATRRQCEVCRCSTPRRRPRCRSCGATRPGPTAGWLEAPGASEHGWTREQLDQLGASIWGSDGEVSDLRVDHHQRDVAAES
jgi:hypothetical protein